MDRVEIDAYSVNNVLCNLGTVHNGRDLSIEQYEQRLKRRTKQHAFATLVLCVEMKSLIDLG